MSAIHDLIAQVSDPRLRERLAAEWASASKERKFGLVFEDHLPELLPLYKARPRRGDLVCRRDGSLKDVWQVQQVKDGIAACIKPGDAAQASPARAPEHGVAQELVRWSVDELLVVRQFGEPIFPSLVPVDVVANGPAEAEGEAAHAMHDTGDLDVGGRRVRKVEASRIDADKNIGVVFFKTSLSTGWDCPRAEVMMSFRHAEDHTYIAQLLGRMVRTPLARRIEKDAALNDVHLFLPYFDTQAVQGVVASLHNQEEVPPTETGSSSELVVLKRREGTESLFAALEELVTYRVNAARAQSPLRRYMAIARSLTLDEIDEEAWGHAKAQIVSWMGERVAALKTSGQFAAAAKAITHVGLRTLAVRNGTGVTEPEADYHIGASSVDIDRLFEEAGRVFSHGLQMEYWRAHAERDATDVKVEAIVLARDAARMAELEGLAEGAFNALYDQHKKAIHKLKEQRRSAYEKLRLATAKPSEVPWHLPESIDFRRQPSDPLWERHLYVEGNGQFRAELGNWEAGVLKEELADPQVVGWLRNVDRKPWSLEVPYETGGDIRPMFPDLVVVRKAGAELVVDILEPHDPSLADNFEKAVGLARFAERHGALFGRIQLIRKQSSVGGEHFARLEINQAAAIKRLLLITSNPQLDELFANLP